MDSSLEPRKPFHTKAARRIEKPLHSGSQTKPNHKGAMLIQQPMIRLKRMTRQQNPEAYTAPKNESVEMNAQRIFRDEIAEAELKLKQIQQKHELEKIEQDEKIFHKKMELLELKIKRLKRETEIEFMGRQNQSA